MLQNDFTPETEAEFQRLIDNEVDRINSHRSRNRLHHRIQNLYPHAQDNIIIRRIVQYLEFLWANFPTQGNIIAPTARDVFFRNYTGYPIHGGEQDNGGSIHIHIHHTCPEI
jgi:hypothetical protein